MTTFIRTRLVALSAAVCAASFAGFALADATTQPAVKPYPLKTCIVSDEALGGDMGDPIVINYKGQEIKFCCNACPKKFNKDPDKYLAKLNGKGPTTKPAG